MKLAHVDTVYGEGSTGVLMKTIHKYLKKKGHESKVYFGRGTTSVEQDVVKISSKIEPYIDAIFSRVTGYIGCNSNIATDRLIAELRLFKPDIVHLHELHGYYVNYYRLINYLKKEKIPIVMTLHCEHMYTGRCGYSYTCNQWIEGCVKCEQLYDYPATLYFDRSSEQYLSKKELFSNLDNIVVVSVSDWLGGRASISMLKDKSHVRIYNGIDTEQTYRQVDCSELRYKYNLDGFFVVIAVASNILHPRKGGRWVIELAKRLIDNPIKFFLIGVDDESIEVPHNVIPVKKISDPHLLAKFYSVGDVKLIVSESETFSLTTAESLACGTPVIGFRSGGPSEIAPQPYGAFVPFGDIDSLQKLVLSLLSGEVSLASSEHCVDYANKMFGNDRMCNEYLQIYSNIMTAGN